MLNSIKKPRVLVWDIETSLMGVTVFQLKQNDYINHHSILKDWHLISASWKWLGEDKVYHAINKHGDNDTKLLVTLSKLLAKANVIVHHNGDNFDVKSLHTRMVIKGLKPTYSKLKTVDTLKEAKKHFRFSSNSLSYLAKVLGVPQKKNPDGGWWMQEYLGKLKNWKPLLEYNDRDVVALEAVYLKMLPYIDHPVMSLKTSENCINCGSEHTYRDGVSITRGGVKKQDYQCQDCGKYFNKPLIDKIKK